MSLTAYNPAQLSQAYLLLRLFEPLKQCSKCQEIKPRERFADDKSRPDNKAPNCKDCKAKYYQENREREKQKMREYRERPGVTEKIQTWHKDWNKKHVFKKTASNHNAHAKDRINKVTAHDLWSLWKKQRGICPLTGDRLNRENSQLDHIVSRTKGGTNQLSNLRWVQRDANYAKRDLSDAEFIELCRKVATRHLEPKKEG